MIGILDDIGCQIRFTLDCMMTTFCNDRPLPEVLNDFTNQDDGSVFNRMIDFVSS